MKSHIHKSMCACFVYKHLSLLLYACAGECQQKKICLNACVRRIPYRMYVCICEREREIKYYTIYTKGFRVKCVCVCVCENDTQLPYVFRLSTFFFVSCATPRHRRTIEGIFRGAYGTECGETLLALTHAGCGSSARDRITCTLYIMTNGTWVWIFFFFNDYLSMIKNIYFYRISLDKFV